MQRVCNQFRLVVSLMFLVIAEWIVVILPREVATALGQRARTGAGVHVTPAVIGPAQEFPTPNSRQECFPAILPCRACHR